MDKNKSLIPWVPPKVSLPYDEPVAKEPPPKPESVDKETPSETPPTPPPLVAQKDLKDILKEVLKQREKYDFLEKHNTDIYRSLKDDKLSEGIKNVLRGQISQPDDESIAMYAAETMKEDFCKLGYDIAIIGDDMFLYDVLDWRPLIIPEARHFISRYLKKCGLPKSKAESVSAIDRYTKQVYFSLYQSVDKKKSEKALINAANCTVEIDPKGNITQREHNKADFFFYVLPYSYDPDAVAPRFMKFLDEVLPKDNQRIVQEFFGCCFMRWVKHEKVLCQVGSGANGKSVLLETIRFVLGEENVTAYSINSLCDEKSTTRYNVDHKLVNISTDFAGKIWNNGIFKQMASGEPVEARRLYHDSVIITDYARLAFNSNSMPNSNDTSAGFMRRLLLVEFNTIIPEDKRDPNLTKKLCTEAPGILNWMIEGLIRFIQNDYKFSKSDSLNASLQAYQDSTDTVKAFMDSQSYTPGNQKVMTLKGLYKEYQNYCSTENIKNVEKMTNFKIKLVGLGYKIEGGDKTKKVIRVFLDTPNSINSPIANPFSPPSFPLE